MTDFIKEIKKCKYLNKEFVFAGGYLFLLTVYLSRLFLDTTMWYLGWAPHNFLLFIKLCAICILVKIIFYDKWSIKEAAFGILFSLVCLIVYLKTGYRETLDLIILVIGAKDVNFRDIVKVYFATGVTLLIITMLASLVGIIPNLIYYKNNHIRNSFGVIYPTDFAAHVFYLVLAYLYLKYDKIKYWDCLAILVLSFFVYKFCRSETSSICLFLTAIVGLYFVIRKKIEFLKDGDAYLLSFLGIISMPFMMIFSLFATLKYENIEALTKLNQIISGRLGLSLNAIRQQGISLFGKSFSMIGGGRAEGYQEGYNFIDNSYVNVLVRFGILLTVLILVAIITIIIKNIKSKQTILPCIIALIAIHCFMEHHLTEITYMFFILALFTKEGSGQRGLLNMSLMSRQRITSTMLSFPLCFLSFAIMSYSIAAFGMITEWGVIYILLSMAILIEIILYMWEKIDTKFLLTSVIIWLIIAIIAYFINGVSDIALLYNSDIDIMHKRVFTVIMAAVVVCPTVYTFFYKKRKTITSILIVLSVFISFFVIRKTMVNRDALLEEITSALMYIDNFRNKEPDMDLYADRNAYLYSIYINKRVSVGQPDINSEKFVYFADATDNKINMTRKADIKSEKLTDEIIVYFKTADIK